MALKGKLGIGMLPLSGMFEQGQNQPPASPLLHLARDRQSRGD